MTLGLGRKICDQEGDADGAEHRNQDHQRAPRRRRSEDVGVVVDQRVAGKHQVVNQPDQIAEQHGAKTGDDTQAKRQQRELRQRQLPALLGLRHACHRIGSRPGRQSDVVAVLTSGKGIGDAFGPLI